MEIRSKESEKECTDNYKLVNSNPWLFAPGDKVLHRHSHFFLPHYAHFPNTAAAFERTKRLSRLNLIRGRSRGCLFTCPFCFSLNWDYAILLTYTYRRDREVSGNSQMLSYLIILLADPIHDAASLEAGAYFYYTER
jgi:hypothetical protein